MKLNLLIMQRLCLPISLSALAILGVSAAYAGTASFSWENSKVSVEKSSLNKALQSGAPLSQQQLTELRHKMDLLTSQQLSRMGTKDGGGGDSSAFEFQAIAKTALDNLQALLPEDHDELLKRNILSIIENAKIIFVDDALDVEVNGLIQSSVAFNSPKNQTILVNRQKWNGLFNESLKETIALHEFLSLMKIESTGSYSISSKLWLEPSKNSTRPSDEGPIPSAVYLCEISSDNMIGIGSRYQITLSENRSQVMYSQFSLGNLKKEMILSGVEVTQRNFPATVRKRGSEYFLESRFYNTEQGTSRTEDAILDTQSNTLKLILPDGRLLPISCKLVARY